MIFIIAGPLALRKAYAKAVRKELIEAFFNAETFEQKLQILLSLQELDPQACFTHMIEGREVPQPPISPKCQVFLDLMGLTEPPSTYSFLIKYRARLERGNSKIIKSRGICMIN
ncbi:MAG UNVERIFIED_CONTAM: hypothetical protein LVQ98_07370 [Rickettsiaceae bacterium]